MPNSDQLGLDIWTVTRNPSDFPGMCVARRWRVTSGTEVATDDHYVSPELEPLREIMRRMGLTCIPRQNEDDPVVVESWL